MKSFRNTFVGVSAILFALVLRQSFTLADDDDYEESSFELSTLRSLRDLTQDEEILANEARAHIVKTIENNLVRLMTVISARNGRRPRQEEEGGGEDEDVAAVTPNPNVLPQVAQILGAIFSGSLNISRVVDQTFGLVPNVVRNQVGGIVKLLTGETMEEASTTVAVEPAAVTAAGTIPPTTTQEYHAPVTPSRKTAKPVVQTTPVDDAEVVEIKPFESILQAAPPIESTPATTPSSQQQNNGTSKQRYRIKNRTRQTSTTARTLLEDDEIEKLEEDIRRAARAYEPYVKDKEPRVFAPIFRNIFGPVDFNSTDITRAVPSIFKGARQAFVLLNNLGILDVNDVFDELGVGAESKEDEEEEEEEEE